MSATMALHSPIEGGLKGLPWATPSMGLVPSMDNALVDPPKGGHVNPQDVGAGTAPTPG